MTTLDPAIEAQLEATREARLESYLEFLRIPSISALPEHAGDMRRAAEWIAAELTRIGFEHAEVCATPWHPIVYADWLHAEGAPTVLVYCHYDVQPVDPIELWDTAPFEPFVRDGRMIGRGAADDKGQLHMHLRAAEALFATRGRLPLNLRIVFEGEEESTSASMPGWLEANRDRLAADVVVISDTGFFEGNIPAHDRVAPRDPVHADRRQRAAGRPALGQLRRERREPGQRPRPDHRRAQGPRRRHPGPGLLRRRHPGRRGGPGAPRRAALRRGRLPRPGRRAGAGRRGRLHGPRARRRPAHARCQRHLGRLPGRRQQDDHPGPCPRQGEHAPRRPPGPADSSSSGSATFVLPGRPAGRPGRGHPARGRPAERDARRPPGRARGREGDRRRRSGASRSSAATAARSRSPRCSSSSSA